MITPLRVLFVEDSEDDMLLQLRQLRQGGYEPAYTRVQTPAELTAALEADDWQVILSDYSLPQFTGLEALKLVQKTGRDVPFLLISGTIGEETAVESMKAGAADYLLKSSLTRLVPAVRRELRDADDRRCRRRAEAELRHSQSLLSLIYDHTDETLALFSAGADGELRAASVNRAWLDFAAHLGRPQDARSCLGLTFAEMLRRLAANAPLVADLGDAFAASEARLFETEWPTAAEPLVTEQQFIAFSHPDGRHVLWAGRDVTARHDAERQQRRLEAQLGHAQKLETLGTLASGIAHDFNNILAGLSGHAELLHFEAAQVPAARDSLQQLRAGIYRATDLVRRILAFSRKRASLRKPLHLGPVVHEALQFLRPLVPREIVIETQLPAECPAVRADAGQVHQVIINLCTNAVQAMPPTGGRLLVALEAADVEATFAARHPPLRPGEHVRLRVRDTGCGMSDETRARLFEPFFTTKSPGVGTGLGLAVVADIVRSHQGVIEVDSRPGQGTTFDLYFPTTGDSDAPPVAQAVHSAAVLFVDDEEYLTQMGAALLSRLGYPVTTFTDPEKALAAFVADPRAFSVLITDLTMPGLKGTDLAARVREVRADVPVVLTTGFSGPHELERARQLGFSLVLEKPFTLPKFVELLERALRGER